MILHSDTGRSAVSTPLPALVSPLPFLDAQVAVTSAEDGLRLLAVPYSTTGRTVLLAIDVARGTTESYPLHETAAPALVAGPDGRAYLGTSSGRLLRVDPAGKLVALGRPLPGEPFTRALCTRDGRLYFGTAPAGAVLRLDTRHPRRPVPLRPPGDGARAVTALAELPHGRVAAFIAGTAPGLFLLAPDDTTEFHPLPITVRHAVPLDDGVLVSADEGVFHLTNAGLFPHAALPENEPIFDLQCVGEAILASGRTTKAIMFP